MALEGTALLCDCCPPGRKTKLGEYHPKLSEVEIQKRKDGTHHIVVFSIPESEGVAS